jgi:putative oxidoreductase
MSDLAKLISRVLLSAVFILYGYFKFVNVAGILNNPGTKHFWDLVQPGTAVPEWLGYLIAAIEVFGGVAVLVGFLTRWAAAGLVIWIILVTYFGHPFWTMEGADRLANESNFFKNLAIMGGYLMLVASGPGRYSIDGGRG